MREEDFPQIQREVATYERLRALVGEWVDAALEIARLQRERRHDPQGKSARKRRGLLKTKSRQTQTKPPS